MKKTIRDFDIKNKVVLIRCDFNVPIQENKIIDNTRIVTSIPTIRYAIENGAKVVLFSHLGRVKTEEDKLKNDLKIVSLELEKQLGSKVIFIDETRGKKLEDAISTMNPGDVLLVQNTRYEDLEGKKESSNDEELGKYWASLGEIFINDAFGTIHREHASNVGISSYLESGIGFLVEKELLELSKVDHPKRPFVVMLGGSKVEDKIGVIKNLVAKADKILIGGGMSYTFLKAAGYSIGKSLLDENNIAFCKEILEKYKDIVELPVDAVLTDSIDEKNIIKTVDVGCFDSELMAVDIGNKTVEKYTKIVDNAETILWNGPYGVYEDNDFAIGTKKMLNAVCNSKAISILGGGDMVAAASKFGFKEKVTHASTGGGATLAYLEGIELPGLKNIAEKE